MSIIDSKGRLFGKVSLLDLGAACVILLVVVGIFFFPGTPVTQVTSAQNVKEINVDVLVRGLSVSDFDALLAEFDEEKKANIVIRNQPAGQVEIVSTKLLPRTTPVPQPDGTVKALPDPRPEVTMIKDLIITLKGRAQITNNGAVLDNTKKVKIGTPIQLEGGNYDFNGSIVSVRAQE